MLLHLNGHKQADDLYVVTGQIDGVNITAHGKDALHCLKLILEDIESQK